MRSHATIDYNNYVPQCKGASTRDMYARSDCGSGDILWRWKFFFFVNMFINTIYYFLEVISFCSLYLMQSVEGGGRVGGGGVGVIRGILDDD